MLPWTYIVIIAAVVLCVLGAVAALLAFHFCKSSPVRGGTSQNPSGPKKHAPTLLILPLAVNND